MRHGEELAAQPQLVEVDRALSCIAQRGRPPLRPSPLCLAQRAEGIIAGNCLGGATGTRVLSLETDAAPAAAGLSAGPADAAGLR
eukprot:15222937-Alexandrium_andersonii.AAC.1